MAFPSLSWWPRCLRWLLWFGSDLPYTAFTVAAPFALAAVVVVIAAPAVAALFRAGCCGVWWVRQLIRKAIDSDCSCFVELGNSWVSSAQGIAVSPMAVRQTVVTL